MLDCRIVPLHGGPCRRALVHGPPRWVGTCFGGTPQRAECAIVWGANPDKLDEHGHTVVERSAFFGKPEVCRMLIGRGCDIHGKNEVWLPLMLAMPAILRLRSRTLHRNTSADFLCLPTSGTASIVAGRERVDARVHLWEN